MPGRHNPFAAQPQDEPVVAGGKRINPFLAATTQPTPAAEPPGPADLDGTRAEVEAELAANQSKGYSITQLRDEAERDLVAERERGYAEASARHAAAMRNRGGALQTMGVTDYSQPPPAPSKPKAPTALQVEAEARGRTPQAAMERERRRADWNLAFANGVKDASERAAILAEPGAVERINADVDRRVRERAYTDGVRGTRILKNLSPLDELYDFAKSRPAKYQGAGTGRIEDHTPDEVIQILAEERQASEDPMLARIGTEALPAAIETIVGAGTTPGLGMALRGGVVATHQAKPETPEEAAAALARGTGTMYLGSKIQPLVEAAPGIARLPMAFKAPTAGALANPTGDIITAGLTGQDVTGEGLIETAIVGGGTALHGLGPRVRAEGFGKKRTMLRAEQQAAADIETGRAALEQQHGAVDRSEPAPPAAPPRGMGTRAPKPARTMTEQEAGQVKQTYLAKGGDPDKVLSPERVADAARGEKPKDRVVGKRIVKGYVPSTDPIGDGLVEQGAEAAVTKAIEQDIAVVSSGVDAQTGEGYAVGEAPSGRVVEVRAAPQPEVAAPRLPEKAGGELGNDSTPAQVRKAIADLDASEAADLAGIDSGELAPNIKDREAAKAASRRSYAAERKQLKALLWDLEHGDLKAPAPQPAAPGQGDFDIDPATGLPNYLSHVQPSRPLKPGPMRRMDNPERGTVGVPEPKPVGGVLRAGARAVAATGRGVANVLRGALGETAETVRRATTRAPEVGAALADDITKARVAGADYKARHQDRLTQAQKEWSGTGFGGKAKTQREAQAPVAETEHGASLRAREIIEGRAQPEATEAGAYDATGRLLAETWNDQSDMGFTINRGGGDEPMRKIEGAGKVLPNSMNQTGSWLFHRGRAAGEAWDTLVKATVERNPNADAADVESWLLERHEAQNAGVPGHEGHIASEFGRKYALPDFIKISGEWVPIQETSMFKRVTDLVDRGSDTVGAQAVFGRGDASTVNARRKAFIEAGGTSEGFDRAMRAAYGQEPFKLSSRLPPMPETVKGLVSLGRGLALTGSPIWNTPDIATGNQAKVFGYWNNLRGIMDAAVNLAHKAMGQGETARMASLEKAGFRNRLVRDATSDVHAGKSSLIHSDAVPVSAAKAEGEIGRGLKVAGRGLKQAFSDTFNQFQEDVAASASERFMTAAGRSIEANGGKAPEWMVQRFRLAGVDRVTAERLLTGQMDFGEAIKTLHRAGIEGVSNTTSSNIRKSQQSLLEHHPVTKGLYMFVRFAGANLRTTGRAAASFTEGWARALKTKGLSAGERAKIATQANVAMTRFVAATALQGLAVQLFAGSVQSAFTGGANEEWEKFSADPVGYASRATAFAAAGGPAMQLVGSALSGGIPLRSTPPGRAVEAGKMIYNGVTLDFGEALNSLERLSPLFRSMTGGAVSKQQQAIKREEAKDEKPRTGMDRSRRRSHRGR